MTYVQPLLTLFLLAASVGALQSLKHAKGARATLLVIGVLGLFMTSWPPVGWLFLRILEAPYPPRQLPPSDADAIVVLASTVYPVSPPIPTPRLGNDTFERTLYAAWLYKHWRPLPVLVSGGTNLRDTPPYALLMRDTLRLQGVPDSVIWSEQQSHSTYENAYYGARFLKKMGIRRIILVTEAYHMLRAQKSFQRQGLEVVPAACGYRAYGRRPYVHELLPNWEPIAWNEDSLHEFVGLLWYRMHGWI